MSNKVTIENLHKALAAAKRKLAAEYEKEDYSPAGEDRYVEALKAFRDCFEAVKRFEQDEPAVNDDDTPTFGMKPVAAAAHSVPVCPNPRIATEQLISIAIKNGWLERHAPKQIYLTSEGVRKIRWFIEGNETAQVQFNMYYREQRLSFVGAMAVVMLDVIEQSIERGLVSMAGDLLFEAAAS